MSAAPVARTTTAAPEARSGLDPWVRADLPAPPTPKGLGWVGVVGPGVIVLGASIGSGEFLLGPAVFVRHGLSLLWVTTVAVLLQTVFNTEVMRYTLATGEPVFTGFMRTRPSSTAWAWLYAALYFLQVGWPAWAGTAAAAIFFLFARRLAGPADAAAIYYIGVGTFLACVAVLSVGRRIERTLELLNWVLVVCILGSFLALAVLFVPAGTWFAAAAGLGGLRRGGRQRSTSFRRGWTSSCWGPSWRTPGAAASATSPCRTGRATRATAWESGRDTSPPQSAATR